MAFTTSVTDIATRRLPKALSPRGHAIADYLTIGAFLLAGSLFWRRNKSAALASMICGGAELVTNLLTDYPGGVAKVIPFHTHKNIDMGLAAMTATMPEFLKFNDASEKKFFLLQAGVITGAANLTNFEPNGVLLRERELRRTA